MTPHEIAMHLAEKTDLLEPVFEHAEGMRRRLEERGWSPTMAEEIAGAWLIGFIGSK